MKKLKKRHKKYLREWTDNMVDCEQDQVDEYQESNEQFKLAKKRLKLAKELRDIFGNT